MPRTTPTCLDIKLGLFRWEFKYTYAFKKIIRGNPQSSLVKWSLVVWRKVRPIFIFSKCVFYAFSYFNIIYLYMIWPFYLLFLKSLNIFWNNLISFVYIEKNFVKEEKKIREIQQRSPMYTIFSSSIVLFVGNYLEKETLVYFKCAHLRDDNNISIWK